MYAFPVPNTKLKIYHLFTYGILVLNVLGMFRVTAGQENSLEQTSALLLVIALMTLWDLRNFKKNRRLLPVGLLLIAFSFYWIRFGANWAFIVNILLWFLYTISRRRLIITVSAEEVTYPSYPKKHLPWSELNNVMLKDGLLTIDRKNNKLYQHYIRHSEEYADEVEFNEFCRKQLIK